MFYNQYPLAVKNPEVGLIGEMCLYNYIPFIHVISHMLNEGKRLYCAFIDFTKAFDYVVRDEINKTWNKREHFKYY